MTWTGNRNGTQTSRREVKDMCGFDQLVHRNYSFAFWSIYVVLYVLPSFIHDSRHLGLPICTDSSLFSNGRIVHGYSLRMVPYAEYSRFLFKYAHITGSDYSARAENVKRHLERMYFNFESTAAHKIVLNTDANIFSHLIQLTYV
jgi:hypothetical protein